MEKEKVIKTELPEGEVFKEKAPELLSMAAFILLIVLLIGNLSCLTLFFLNGFGVTHLSDTALCALAAATVAEVAGLIGMIIKKIVPA